MVSENELWIKAFIDTFKTKIMVIKSSKTLAMVFRNPSNFIFSLKTM